MLKSIAVNAGISESELSRFKSGVDSLKESDMKLLADYLNVDRSTMCNELSKMQKDGIIEYSKNQFLLKDSLMFQ